MFRAYDAERERLVAVKLFTLDLPPEKVHQLVAELERVIACELTHPSLALPLATGITGVSAFLAQDYVAAESLDLAVREYGAAPPVDVLRVAAQLAAALDFAAVVNISHGALHPRDVLLSTDDTRLTGIGVARALEAVGVAAPVRRPYTPPERIAGGAWDRRADIFSLAAMIHELLWARRVSGTGAHAAETLTEIEGADLARLRDTFARALAEDPHERFGTALEFAEGLKAAFPAVTLTPPQVSEKRARRARAAKTPDPETVAAIVEPREPREPREPSQSGAPALPFDVGDVFARGSQMPDLNLRTPEPDPPLVLKPAPVASSAPVAVPRLDREAPPAAINADMIAIAPPAPEIVLHEPEMLSALERSRSAVWPLVLALMVGIAMGFAGGYGIGSQRQNTTAGAAGGRDFTEGAINEPAKPVVEAPIKPVVDPAAKADAPTKTETPAAAAPAPPAEEAGRVLVRSTPEGAHVFVDGREAGRTPATLRDLAHGPHQIRLSADGYVVTERRVVISGSRPSQSLSVALVRERAAAPRAPQAAAPAPAPAAASGSAALRVESRPAGASVYLDGKLVGTTPFSLPAVTVGDHAVRLELNGYKRWSSSVKISATDTNRVTASLER